MAENNQLRQKLQEGINAVKAGDRATGRKLLQEVLQADPRNELAWIWMASCVNTVSERRACLERVVKINPNNARALQALQRLNATEGKPTSTVATPPRRGNPNGIRNILIMLLVVIVVIAGLYIASQIDLGGDENASVAVFPSITPLPPSNTPLPPTATIIPFDGTSGAPTLPATFTPTATALPTQTSTPTPTPYPVAEFQLLYTSLTEGESQPALYETRGDGSDEGLISAGVRDVAYDPSGERIAFIRDVAYPSDSNNPVSDLATYPELFIADLSDLLNATQVTTMQTSIVSSPTWSPEGRELVFVSNFDGQEDVWYITPDGQNLRRLTGGAADVSNRDPAWSPVLGSREILFASDVESFGSTEIYSMELPQPDEEPVTRRLTNATNSSYSPAWADDGAMIVFISDRNGDPDVYTMRSDGANQTPLTVADNGAEDRNPSFTPDGRFVVFISNRQDDRFQSYLISLRGDVLVRLTDHDRNDTSIDYRPELILRLR